MKVNFIPNFIEGSTKFRGWWVVVKIGDKQNKTWFGTPSLTKFDMHYLNQRGLWLINTQKKLDKFNELYNIKLEAIKKNKLKPLVVYECPHCKQLFRTPDKHDCKKDPIKKNCFTCKYSKGWNEGRIVDVGFGPYDGPYAPSYPECVCGYDYGSCTNIEEIKSNGYNMQCKGYEQGSYVQGVYKENKRAEEEENERNII